MLRDFTIVRYLSEKLIAGKECDDAETQEVSERDEHVQLEPEDSK